MKRETKRSFKVSFKAILALVLSVSMLLGILSIMVTGDTSIQYVEPEEVHETGPPEEPTGEPAAIISFDFVEEYNEGHGEAYGEEHAIAPDNETFEEFGDDFGAQFDSDEEEFGYFSSASDDLYDTAFTVEFYVNDVFTFVFNEENPQWPEDPYRLNLDFKGWYDSDGYSHADASYIYSDMRLDAVFTANVRFIVDGVAVESLVLDEGTIVSQPSDPDGDPTQEFVAWISLGSRIAFPVTVTRHLDVTALFRPIPPPPNPLLFDNYYWIAGPGGSVRDYSCRAGCGWNTGNQYSKANLQFLFHPLPLPSGVTQQFAYIVITCERCQIVNFITPRSNQGASLARAGAAPSGLNNVNLGGDQTVEIKRLITYLPGDNGMLLGQTVHRGTVGKPIDPAWAPTVLPNSGWVLIGWLDPHTGILHGDGVTGFPDEMENREYTFIAQYSDLASVIIEVIPASKVYDGLPLETTYQISGLPTNYTIEGITIEEGITNAGSITGTINTGNVVIRNPGGDDVTSSFAVVAIPGTLTVTPRPASVFAEDSWKYVGTRDPGFNILIQGFLNGDAPTTEQLLIKRPGAGTDEAIGLYPNALVLENNGFNNPNYLISWHHGDFEIVPNPLLEGRVITVRGNSQTVIYSGFAHTASGYSVDDISFLESTGFEVTAIARGISAIDVNLTDIPRLNEVPINTVVVTLNGIDVTNLVEIQTIPGELIINPREARAVVDDQWKYIGEADPELTIRLENFIAGHEPETDQFTLFRSNADVEAAGHYIGVLVVENTGFENPNYHVIWVDGTFEIRADNPAFDDLNITVTANSRSFFYNGSPQRAAGYTVGGALPGFFVTAITSDPVATDVSEAQPPLVNAVTRVVVMYNGVDVSDVVPVERIDGTLQIKPLQATVTVTDDWKYIGESDPLFRAEAEGFLEGDEPTADQYSITRPGAGYDEAAGVYPDALIIANTGFNDPNYAITWIPGSFTIYSSNPLFDDLLIDVRGNSNLTAVYHGSPQFAHDYTVDDYEALQELGFEVTAIAMGVSATNVNTAGEPRLNIVPYDEVRVFYNGVEVTDYVAFRTFNGELVIGPRQASVTAEYTYKYIGNADPELTATFDGFMSADIPTADQFSLTRPGAGTDESIGLYTDALIAANVSFNNPNYVVSWYPGDFEIVHNQFLDDMVIAIRGNSLTVTYDGRSHAASGYTVDDYEALEELGFEVTAIATGISAVDVNTTDAQRLNAVPPDTVVVRLNGVNVTNLVNITTFDGELIINPRPASVIANDDWKPLGEADPAFTARFENFIVGQEPDVGQFTIVRSNAGSESAGNYYDVLVVENNGFTDSNYIVSWIPGDFEIRTDNPILKEARIVVTGNSLETAYTGNAQTAAGYTVSELAPGFAVTAVTSDPVATNVSETYTPMVNAVSYVVVTYNGLDVTDMVAVDIVCGWLHIYPIEATVSVENSSKYIGNADPAFTAVADGFLLDDAPSVDQYTIVRPGLGTDENAGLYTDALVVSNIVFDNSNYIVSWIPGDFEILDSNPIFDDLTITVRGNSNLDAIYHGGFHYAHDYTVDDLATLEANGFNVTAVAVGTSATDVTTGGAQRLNVVPQEDVKVLYNGVDVTHLVDIRTYDGELIIGPRSITITASSDSKEYNGAPLMSNGFSITEGMLALGKTVDSLTVSVTGQQTDPGTSANVPSEAVIHNADGRDVTSNYDISYANGSLTVTVNETVRITVTAASDAKQYDGSPLINDGFTTSLLPPGVSEVRATVAGSQTDVGSSANVVTGYTLWNGSQEVTSFYTNVVLTEGSLTVTPSMTEIRITAASDSKFFDGLPLMNSGISYENLPDGVTGISAVVEGSQTDVGSSANEIVAYTFFNGTQDVTAYFSNVI